MFADIVLAIPRHRGLTVVSVDYGASSLILHCSIVTFVGGILVRPLQWVVPNQISLEVKVSFSCYADHLDVLVLAGIRDGFHGSIVSAEPPPRMMKEVAHDELSQSLEFL